MRVPSDTNLLALWAEASGEHSIDRALMLLSACSGVPVEELASLSIGERDSRLLEVYADLFGSTVEAFAECPACKEPLEYSLSTDTLGSPRMQGKAGPLSFASKGYSVAMRLPNSYDLRAIRSCSDVDTAGEMLLELCVVEAKLDRQDVSAKALPAHVRDSIASLLAEADPQADLLIGLNCCVCGNRWHVLFDIERFLWPKITAMARCLLHEVHALASAYGWGEGDILALHPARRRLYVEMVWPTS